MSRRRVALRERGPEPPPPMPVPDSFDIPQVFAKPGCCPKCGVYVGRIVRTHALECDGVRRETA